MSKKTIYELIEKYNASPKQREQLLKVYQNRKFLQNVKKLNWQTVEKNLFNMIAVGVDTFFVQRIVRNKKFGFALTKLKFVTLYGKKAGLKKWNEYCSKQSKTNVFEYKQEKYGWTKDDFDTYNASRAVTLINLQKRHGEVLGKDKFDTYRKRQAYAGCALQYFIDRYGNVEGPKKYSAINKLKGTAAASAIRNGNFHSYQSKIGKEFCSSLATLCSDVGKIYYSRDGQKEFGLYSGESYFFFDFVSLEARTIIEFDRRLLALIR